MRASPLKSRMSPCQHCPTEVQDEALDQEPGLEQRAENHPLTLPRGIVFRIGGKAAIGCTDPPARRASPAWRGSTPRTSAPPREATSEALAAKTASLAWPGMDRVFFVSGGSEAVESCLKIALQYHTANGQKSRRKFISRQRSWHGNTLGALGLSGFAERTAAYEGAFIPSIKLSPANTYRPIAGATAETAGAASAAELEESGTANTRSAPGAGCSLAS